MRVELETRATKERILFALTSSRVSGAPRTPRARKKLNKHTQLILSLRSHFKPVGLVTGLGNSIQFCWRWDSLRKQPSLLASHR